MHTQTAFKALSMLRQMKDEHGEEYALPVGIEHIIRYEGSPMNNTYNGEMSMYTSQPPSEQAPRRR